MECLWYDNMTKTDLYNWQNYCVIYVMYNLVYVNLKSMKSWIVNVKWLIHACYINQSNSYVTTK